MATSLSNLPIEFVLTDIKKSVVQYMSMLCQQYQIPSIMAVQILQEIVYENRLNAYTETIEEIRKTSLPKMDINLTPPIASDDSPKS